MDKIIPYNHFYDNKVKNKENLKNIKIGKEQKLVFNFKNNKSKSKELWLIPIYYKATDYLILKTTRLYIPSPIKKYGKKNILDILLYANDKDEVSFNNFISSLKEIENRIIKKVKPKYDLDNKKFIPLVKYDEYYNCKKISITVSDICQFIGIDGNELTRLDAPTFGYFVIHIKNIWKNDDSYGFNVNCEGGMILPSQRCDIPKLGCDIKYLFTEELEVKKTLEDLEEYQRYFKMKKMGIPGMVVEQKMILAGIKHPKVVLNYVISDTVAKVENELGIVLLEKKEIPIIPSSDSSVSGLKFSASDLLNQGKKLKKVDKSEMQTIKEKVKNDPRIPSLDDIKNAMSNLRKSSII